VLVAALGIDGNGDKHPLGLVEGATENTAVVQALIDNLIERGLDPTVCRLFIVDGAKALSKVIRRTFGAHTPIQRCQRRAAAAQSRPQARPGGFVGIVELPGLAQRPADRGMQRLGQPLDHVAGLPALPPAFSKVSTRC
jgi:hypothetical protein